MKKFNSFEEYEGWTEQFENASDYQMTPVLIDDGWKVSADMFTECKSFKTALRRFSKVFADVEAFDGWFEGLEESCDSGCFQDAIITLKRSQFWGSDEAWEEYINEQTNNKRDIFSWGVEEVDDRLWYIYLNVSGGYAGR